MPKPRKGGEEGGARKVDIDKYTSYRVDPLATMVEEPVGSQGMRIDRELFKIIENRIIRDDIIRKNAELGNWEHVVSHIQQEIFDKPHEYFNCKIP